MDMSGRTAVVTGSAVRIGRSIALSLAQKGCHIVLHYGQSGDAAQSTAEEIRRLGVHCTTVSADLAEANCDDTIFNAVAATDLGPASILVNSAAIFGAGGLQACTDDDWQSHLNINLTAPVKLMQRFAAELGGDAEASVVNIVDWRAQVHPAGHFAYTVSKSGLLAATRMAAQDLSPRIRVNAIAPGPMLPPPGEGPEYIEPVVQKLPLRRSGSPEDIADAVVWLCEASFVTGTLLHVDGGQQFTGGKA